MTAIRNVQTLSLTFLTVLTVLIIPAQCRDSARSSRVLSNPVSVPWYCPTLLRERKYLSLVGLVWPHPLSVGLRHDWTLLQRAGVSRLRGIHLWLLLSCGSRGLLCLQEQSLRQNCGSEDLLLHKSKLSC